MSGGAVRVACPRRPVETGQIQRAAPSTDTVMRCVDLSIEMRDFGVGRAGLKQRGEREDGDGQDTHDRDTHDREHLWLPELVTPPGKVSVASCRGNGGAQGRGKQPAASGSAAGGGAAFICLH